MAGSFIDDLRPSTALPGRCGTGLGDGRETARVPHRARLRPVLGRLDQVLGGHEQVETYPVHLVDAST